MNTDVVFTWHQRGVIFTPVDTSGRWSTNDTSHFVRFTEHGWLNLGSILPRYSNDNGEVDGLLQLGSASVDGSTTVTAAISNLQSFEVQIDTRRVALGRDPARNTQTERRVP